MSKRFVNKIKTFGDFALEIAELSTCLRASVGCVIFPLDCSAIFAVGYNGPPKPLPNTSCVEREGGCGCIHAEANALIKFSPSTVKQACVCVTTVSPCRACAAMIANIGCIVAVGYHTEYRVPTQWYLESAGVNIARMDDNDKISKWRHLNSKRF